jgi:hypothetical protein
MDQTEPLKGLTFSGSIRISCEDFHFQLRGSDLSLVVDFPSFGMLIRARKIADDLQELLKELPPLPRLPEGPEVRPDRKNGGFPPKIRIAVNARPLGKIDFAKGKPKFTPTLLSYFRKI